MLAGMADTLRLERLSTEITRITLDRPGSMNAMNATLVAELHAALDEVGRDPDCRVLMLTGAGRAFSAGLDLKGYGTPTGYRPGDDAVSTALRTQKEIVGLVERLRGLPQVVIAAVNGVAAGGGLALVLASDIRLGGRSARFMAAFIKIGVSGCDIGTSWLLPRLVGMGRAHEMMLTGRVVEADEAERIGLVLRVVDDTDLESAAMVEAELVLANAPFAVRLTKETMWATADLPAFASAVAMENRTQVLCLDSDDQREAVISFVEKRRPRWARA